MFIRVPKPVEELARIFKKNKEKLYLVGGFVRNQIIGISDEENLDIDVCSSCKPQKVIEMLKGSEFSARYLSEEMGVVEILGKIRVEHATFRREKYAFSGVHLPENVEFIDDLSIDAERRDFRCNAIYYDILEDEIVDPLGGVDDTRKKIVQTTISPEKVFEADGERILRMVRIACSLGFNIDDKTYEAAKQNAYKIGSLTNTRKREEFSQIVLADTDYPFLPDKKFAHARGINMLADLGALKYLLPALEEIRTSGIIEDRGKPLYDHLMNVFALSAPEVRLSALLHDVGKAEAMLKFGNFNGEEEFAEVIIEKNLGIEGLNYPKKIVERVKRVVLGVNFNKHGLESAKNMRRFIIRNYEDIDLIVKLKNAIALDKSGFKRYSFSSRQLEKTYIKMKKNNTPFTVGELKISGSQIIKAFANVKVSTLHDLLDEMLLKCAEKPYLNTEFNLLNLAEKLINKKNSIYKE